MSLYKINVGNNFFEGFVKSFCKNNKIEKLNITKHIIIVPSEQAVKFLKMEFLANSITILPNIYAANNIAPEEIIAILATENLFDDINKYKQITSKSEQKLFVKKYLSKFDKDLIFSAKHLNMFVNQLVTTINMVKKYQISVTKLLNFDLIDLPIHLEKGYRIFVETYQVWEKYLKKNDKYDEIAFRNLQISLLTKFLKKYLPHKKITIAGFTDFSDIYGELIYQASQNKNCDLVLYGLDEQLDSSELTKNHPQYQLNNLLKKLKIKHSTIKNYYDTPEGKTNPFIRELFREGNEIATWNQLTNIPLPDWQIIEADDEFEETNIIKEIIKQQLHENSKTKILVIANSDVFARNLISLLKIDNIYPQNSLTKKLVKTNVYNFLYLVYEVIFAKTDDMAKILALLKHEFFIDPKIINDLEIAILRGHKIGNIWQVIAKIEQKGFVDQADLLLNIIGEEINFTHFNFIELLKKHMIFAEKISEGRIWEGELGNFFSSTIYQLFNAKIDVANDNAISYIELLSNLLSDYSFAGIELYSPNIFILDSVQARLFRADLTIIANFSESYWPQKSDSNFPICKPIKLKLGIPGEDLRVGQQALDLFCHGHCPKLYITRSMRDSESLLNQSRFLSRIKLLSNKLSCYDKLSNNQVVVDFKNKFMVKQKLTYKTLAPNPDVNLRPTRYAATDLEKLMSDPYYFYCKKILKLSETDPVNKPYGAVDYGNLVHNIFEKISLGEEIDLEKYIYRKIKDPLYAKLWIPRIKRAVEWLLDYEKKLRAIDDKIVILPEYKQILKYKILGKEIEIICKSDRIEVSTNNIAVIDYKTGSIPSNSDALKFFAMQLQIGAMGFVAGGYNTAKLCYFALKSGEEIVAISEIVSKNHSSLDDFVIATNEHILKLIEHYLQANPFIAQTDSKLQLSYNPYKHLSRIS